ncbi:LysR family transcriptional regulator [Sphingomicrobium clamense]|uniref:LysR family transcriptional regulator n=1 Tax=Sphingomicrobium clamense TaxID=2851013 RepID=A0ABS6V597_9SPHN|nr:LysR family transcriptional regulator [Sphingomicrobium sp. B8]MBW0144737.1 LysR family transcriptional regulator [Sphingomicrobium sp. B8]
MFDWNDVKYFLAVADEGSTLKAARLLGANQTTVARRVSALEAALGLELFEKRQSGYRLSSAGQDLLEKARATAKAAAAVEAEANAATREVAGVVRLTTNETYAEIVLPPLLAKFRRQYPDVRIEVDHSQTNRDLAKGEADVALRFTKDPKGDALVVRHLFDDAWTCYCSEEYAAEHGRPKTLKQLAGHHFISGGGASIEGIFDAWLEKYAPGVEPDLHYDTLTGMISAARAGLGITFISTMTASHFPDLVQLFPPHPRGYRTWLITHDRIRRQPHIKAVMTGLGDLLIERAKETGAA